MKTTIDLRDLESQAITAPRRMRIHKLAVVIATTALVITMAQNASAQGVSQSPCFVPNGACLTGVISTAPASVQEVELGTILMLTTDPARFKFTAGTIVFVTPAFGVPASGLLTVAVFLCGPAGIAVCTPTPSGDTLDIAIPPAPFGNPLIQAGLPGQYGFWNLFALDPGIISRFATITLEAPLPGLVHFVSTITVTPTIPPAPFVSDVSPGCVDSTQTTVVTGGVDGQSFESGARVIVSYIYFVKPNGKFVTGLSGRDSRTPAVMLAQSPTHLGFSIDLRNVHQTAQDNFTDFGGNYYVQVQNPDGQLSGGPMYFTAKPFEGYGHCQ